MMENRPSLKKVIIFSIISNIIFVCFFIIIHNNEYKTYTKNYNNRLNIISNNIKEKYPDITDSEIFEIITTGKDTNNFIRKYGYDINTDSVIKENNNSYQKYLIIELIIIILNLILILIIYLLRDKKQNSEINDIIKLIDDINKNNYNLDIDNLSEEDLSILKDSVYKMMLKLKEQADNSNKDKLSLKTSIEDISHQLRTPLTSILINIDNILDNPNLDDSKKNEFIRRIKREAYNMKKLIEVILKLSKFEVNTIEFNRKKNSIMDIIDKTNSNVSSLADLKNIDIRINGKDFKLLSDFNWEVEAITNILKNAIEHSYNDSVININLEDNKVYSKIDIINAGEVISKTDLKHLFERFYKGENSSNDSFGIGLSLSKMIVEKDNGKIFVDSKDNKTIFTIKYYK